MELVTNANCCEISVWFLNPICFNADVHSRRSSCVSFIRTVAVVSNFQQSLTNFHFHHQQRIDELKQNSELNLKLRQSVRSSGETNLLSSKYNFTPPFSTELFGQKMFMPMTLLEVYPSIYNCSFV